MPEDVRKLNLHFRNCYLNVTFEELLRELFAYPKMLGDLIKSQKLQKYPFQKSKGLFTRGFILVTNLLVDVLVKKSVALCKCIIRKSLNEWTLSNRYFIEVSRWVPLTN